MSESTVADRLMEALLKTNHWRTAPELAREAKCHSGPTEPVTRAVIAGLIRQGVPVISSRSGFKIATSEVEIQDACQTLKQRADEINERARNLWHAWHLWKAAGKLVSVVGGKCDIPR